MTDAPPITKAPIRGRSILETAALFAGGASDPVTETRRILEAVAHHPDQAIFIRLFAARATAEAEASRHRHEEPLDTFIKLPYPTI